MNLRVKPPKREGKRFMVQVNHPNYFAYVFMQGILKKENVIQTAFREKYGSIVTDEQI